MREWTAKTKYEKKDVKEIIEGWMGKRNLQ